MIRSPRAHRWPGLHRKPPVVAVHLGTAEISMLAVRDRPLRITASGTAQLRCGVVRNEQVRRVAEAAGAMEALADALVVPRDSPTVVVVDPAAVTYDVDADRIDASIDAGATVGAKRCALQAGFGNVAIDPVPAAMARLATMIRHPPVFVSGFGWLALIADGHFEAGPTRRRARIAVGDTPTTLERVDRVDSIPAVPGVELRGPWPLLLGGALRGLGYGPSVAVSKIVDVTAPLDQDQLVRR